MAKHERQYTVRTANAQETQALGQRLGRVLFPGAVIGLVGELGSGKTCFVKGIAAGLGLNSDEISSPTFTLIAEHYTDTQALYHIDLYRLEGANIGELSDELGIEDYLFGRGATAIEWFQFLPAGTLNDYLLVSLCFGDDDERTICFRPQGKSYEQMIRRLRGE